MTVLPIETTMSSGVRYESVSLTIFQIQPVTSRREVPAASAKRSREQSGVRQKLAKVVVIDVPVNIVPRGTVPIDRLGPVGAELLRL